MFFVDLLSGQGSLSSCLSGSCTLFLWVWRAGRKHCGHVWWTWERIRESWPSVAIEVPVARRQRRLARVAAGRLLPALGPAGWGEPRTRRGCAGCTLCLGVPSGCRVPGGTRCVSMALGHAEIPVWGSRVREAGHPVPKVVQTECCWAPSYAGWRRSTPVLSLQQTFSARGRKSEAGHTGGRLFVWESDWLVDMPVSNTVGYQPICSMRIVWFCSYYCLNNKLSLNYFSHVGDISIF